MIKCSLAEGVPKIRVNTSRFLVTSSESFSMKTETCTLLVAQIANVKPLLTILVSTDAIIVASLIPRARSELPMHLQPSFRILAMLFSYQ